MKFPLILSMLFAWCLYTDRRLSITDSRVHSQDHIEQVWEHKRKAEKKRLKRRQKPRVPPRPRRRRQAGPYTRSLPKSVRHLDQKSLRRMYRNG